MKSYEGTACDAYEGSHPAWVRGLKFHSDNLICFTHCRTPRGVRGLKFDALHLGEGNDVSHPAWGAWIEII